MGGAAVPPDLPLRAVEVFGPGVQILNGYGSTETTSAVVANVGIEYEARPDSVGRPNLTGDVKIVDADGTTLGVGEIGEICMRSPQVVPGYWNDADATAAAFRDGWFHSGDVGYVDDEGFLYVVDRLKDVVIRGGENVYCVEVEAVLHEHPAVADVAVIGIDERVMGERVCAVVVPRGRRRPARRPARLRDRPPRGVQAPRGALPHRRAADHRDGQSRQARPARRRCRSTTTTSSACGESAPLIAARPGRSHALQCPLRTLERNRTAPGTTGSGRARADRYLTYELDGSPG